MKKQSEGGAILFGIFSALIIYFFAKTAIGMGDFMSIFTALILGAIVVMVLASG